MLTYIGGQILAFVLGVLSCIASWYWLLRVKPDIRVASVAAFNPRTGKLGVKVVNFSNRQATNVQVQAAVATKPPIGIVTTRVVGKLRWDTVLALDPIQNINGFWTLPTTFVFICENGAELIQELDRHRDSGVEKSRRIYGQCKRRSERDGSCATNDLSA